MSSCLLSAYGGGGFGGGNIGLKEQTGVSPGKGFGMRRGGKVGRPIRKMHTGGSMYLNSVLANHNIPMDYNLNALSGSNMSNYNQGRTAHYLLHQSGSFTHYGDMNFDTITDIGDIILLINQILSRGGGGNRTQLMNVKQQLQTNPTPQLVNRVRQMVNRMNGSTSMRMNRRNKTSYRRGGRINRRRR